MAAAPTIGMLRPALELAWAVAKVGGVARPPEPAPGRLRPLMRFAKLPDRALSTVRQVVDEDDDFRRRVAGVADEAALGRASWLWLVRPENWEADLDELAEAADVAASEVQEEKEERSARKRLGAAEVAVARAEAELTRLRQANAELEAAVSAERQARRRAEAERGEIEGGRRAAREEQARLEQTVAGLEAKISSLAGELDETVNQLAGSSHQLDVAGAEVRRLSSQLQVAAAETSALTTDRDQARVAVSFAVSRASSAARQLDEALAEVARTVGGDEAADRPEGAGQHGTVRAARPPASYPGAQASPRGPRVQRRPVPLPPAVFDDSFEAADHLVRVPGILLVVDGYNVTISSWPHLELPRQRHRLVDALAELAMRAGTSVHVVFDGSEAGGRFGPPAAARRAMRVTFSPESVDADEVIVDLVQQLDPSQPVVVATDDRQVRDAVRRRGANVISVAQLLAVVGRTPGSATG